MTKEDIIRKLTSRKFWLAVALFVSGLLTAFGKDAKTAETISGLIMQGAAVLAYVIGEGLADAARASGDVVVHTIAPDELPEIADDGED
jgi:hypothetical protein